MLTDRARMCEMQHEAYHEAISFLLSARSVRNQADWDHHDHDSSLPSTVYLQIVICNSSATN